MDLNYVEVVCTTRDSDAAEWLMALLSDAGFESFAEEDGGFKAYVASDYYIENEANILNILESHSSLIGWKIGNIEARNWNEKWEKEYQPVWIEGRLLVRAPFHEALSPDSEAIELVIEPKMSFGTGHHSTTTLVARHMLEMDLKDKRVLDMGCGTGILAILASRLGAAFVKAIDNHPWASINAQENCERNGILNIDIVEGDATSLGNEYFDVVLANINRNILLDDMRFYRKVMLPRAKLVLSGFLEEDLDAICREAENNGLVFDAFSKDGKWLAAWFSLN